MKNTILILALALTCLSLNSCSRGYGCPYTSVNPELTKVKKPQIQIIEQEAKFEEKEAVAR